MCNPKYSSCSGNMFFPLIHLLRPGTFWPWDILKSESHCTLPETREMHVLSVLLCKSLMPLLSMITSKLFRIHTVWNNRWISERCFCFYSEEFSFFFSAVSKPRYTFQVPLYPSVFNFIFSSELQKYRRYEIVMTAYNVIGESPPSAPVEVFVGEAGKWLCEN